MKALQFIPAIAVAALDGRKTQTRRVLNPQPVFTQGGLGDMWRIDYGDTAHYFFSDTIAPDVVARLCHYKVGERRCLGTTWAVSSEWDETKPTEISRHIELFWHAGLDTEKPKWAGKSRPGRFLPNDLRHLMPVFEIVAVRAERLNDISEADATAEGIRSFQVGFPRSTGEPYVGYQTEYGLTNWIPTNRPTAKLAYVGVWEKIHGAAAWQANPWVWAISFRRISP